MKTLARKYAAYMLLGLARLVGGGSLIAFMVFVYAGAFGLLDMGLAQSGILWLDTALSLAFFVQHSGMVRRSFRRGLARFIPEEYGGALYAIASGTILFAVLVLWQESAETLMAPRGIFRWPFRAVFFFSLAGFVWGIKSLKLFDPFGVRPILGRLRGMPPRPMPFVVQGPYRWVRHPLYFLVILMIWSCPDLTTDRLLFNGVWTVWIVFGAFMEERDLIAEFGDAYRAYQRRVPMFLPGWLPLRGKTDDANQGAAER